MIKYLISKALGKKSQDDLKTEEFVDKLKKNSNYFINLIVEKFEFIKKELKIIREKSKNLLETNYKLGLHHLEKGNLQDASLRFSIIIKFWPNFYEAYYQKAYIQMLQGNSTGAKVTLDNLFSRNPENLDNKFQTLKEQIELSLQLSTPND